MTTTLKLDTEKNDVNKTHSNITRTHTPRLSVLVPFFHDNPLPLMKALSEQTSTEIELLFYDDGTANHSLTQELMGYVRSAKVDITLITALQNKGRAIARNTLKEAARADWVLFLDADMRPKTAKFLTNYVTLIEANIADVFFGGFEVENHAESPDRELHRALSQSSDCLPLMEREAAGPQFVATSNLCVKKSVLNAEPFDNQFQGWGWEDSEWAARIAKKYRLKHIENSALHLGLETDTTLLSRFQNSAENYKRFTSKHPQLAEHLALYRLVKKLARLPAQRFLAPLYRIIVLTRFLPMRLRILGLKLWRASWYARAF